MSYDKIRVLVVEDSTVMRMLLVRLLESDPQISVVGTVCDGQAAIEFVLKQRPDVVLMDIHMPRLDGFQTTRRIMETMPLPIVMCSATFNTKDVVIAFRAMEAGAIACVEKPVGSEQRGSDAIAAELLQTVKLMSEVKVVRRTPRPQLHSPRPPVQALRAQAEVRVIGIGASTGGPPVLQSVLAGLPASFSAPVLIVQHIAHGFVAGMAEWLSSATDLEIHIAAHRMQPRPGHVYLAPDDFHLTIGADGMIALSRSEPENHLRPAVSVLFRSLALNCGPSAIGVLLTGMGQDGAEELRLMKDQGAITIAQDHASSAVHGMPGVAIALGGATHVLPTEKIAAALIDLVNSSRSSTEI